MLVTNVPKRLQGVCERDIGLSDFHCMVCFATKAFLPRSEKRTIFYRSYKHFNVESYRQDLRAIPFHVSEVFDSVDDSYWFCHDRCNYHAPNCKCHAPQEKEGRQT